MAATLSISPVPTGAQPANNLVGDVVMPPPETASLGKYTDISVGMYTGTAHVNIPLFTLTEGPLSVPMSLSYQTSGVQVGEPAGMTGLGWSLSAGGRIMRTVMGKPDEAINGYRSRGATYAGIPNMNPAFPLQPATPNYEAVEGIATGLYDGEADVFSFHFGGWSGKFYMDANGAVVLVPKQNIRIEPHFSEQYSLTGLRGFTVTTPDGAKYYFGIAPGIGTPVVEELQSVTPGSSGSIFITAWMLLRIESFDATSRIDFSYTEERYGYKNRASCDSRLWGSGDCPQWQHFKVITRRLHRISSMDKTVELMCNTPREDLRYFNESFITDQHAKRLDSIKITDNSVLCKRFDFSYDYWKDETQYATGEPEDKRLRLLSVQERSCDGSIVIPSYTIQYFGTNYLPNRLSRAIDHWGYYNGAEAQNNHNNLNLPPINETITYTGSPRTNTPNSAVQNTGDPIRIHFPGSSNRETNPAAMVTGNLRSITYPTGGVHSFEYEANDYWGKKTEVNERIVLRASFPPEGGCVTSLMNMDPSPIVFSAAELPRLVYRIRYRRPSACSIGNNRVRIQVFPSGSTISLPPADFSTSGTTEEFRSGTLLSLFPQLTAGVSYEFKAQFEHIAFNFEVVDIETTEVWRNLPVGGLRVKAVEISDGSGQGNTIRKTYRYVNQGNPSQSSGILYNAPRYWVNFDNFPIHGGALGSPYYGCYNCTLFFDHSIVPLSGFEGSHIGYANVTEDHEGNGRRELVFFTEAPSPGLGQTYQATEYPYPPEQLRVSAGNTYTSATWSEADARVSWEENQPVYADYTLSSGLMVKAIKVNFAVSTSWQTYRIKTRIPYLVKESKVTTDGVEKVTTFEYRGISSGFPAYEHYFSTAVSVLNSDGVAHRTKTQYAAERGDTFMLERYMVGIPIHQVYMADGIAGGYRKKYEDGYPTEYHEILSDSTELLKGSTSQYQQGLPVDFTPMGASTVQYEWLPNRMLKKQRYLSWESTWEYHNNNQSRFLKKSTQIDGQSVEYSYDKLGRLTRISARGGNIVTTIQYNYGGPNSIISTTTYSDAPTQTLTEEFDGLGRPIRSIHNGVVKKEQFYDAYGRMWKETHLPGNFTTYDFDDSPLNRVVKQIFPDGHATRTLYGADGNYYKTTTIDEKGNESSVLTEIVERTHKTINAIGGETTFTYAPHGEPLRVQPPSGGPYIYDYDNRRRLTYKKIPGARAQIFRYYDENNLLKYSIDGKGQRIDHYYDDYLREVRATLAQVPNWNPEAPSPPHGAPGSDILITRYGEEFSDLPAIYKGRVRETSAKLFGSGALQVSGFAETKFSYDNFGRASGRVETFPFLPGNTTATDTWTFQFDHADRLRFEQRNAVGVNTAQTHTYDNFGREIYYVFGAGAPEAAAVAMTWNDRDQMTSKKLGYAGGRQLDLIRYRYNERGWLTHINDVLRERWNTPYEICQGPAPGEGHTFVQMEEQTNLQGLLELLCNEENVVVRGTDPCEQGDCFDELADYQASLLSGLKKEKPVTELAIHNLYRIAAQVIPLPQTPYRWTSDSGAATLLSRDDSQALASDLRNWMDANQYRYDSVTVRPKVIPGKDGNLELSIRVYGTNLPLDFLTFSFDNATSHSRAIFRKTNPRLAPCAVKPIPERETQLQSLAQNPAQLSYPTALYKVLVAGSATPLWRFEAELGGLNPNHRREVRIPVMNADERFSVRMTNGATAVWTLAQLLNERQQNGLSGVTAIERIIEKTTTNPCTLPPLECSAAQKESQTRSLAAIQNAMCNIDPAQLSFPLTLYYVRLCDGSTAYILGQNLLQNLQGPYQVLGQMQVTGPDQLFNVAITRRRPLFAMQFAYEPNGNIGELKWKVTTHDVKYYINDYDPLNRLLGSSYGVEREVQSGTALPFIERIGTQEYDEFGISYDAIGNIEKLSRRGLIPSGNCFTPGLIDQLTYHYGDAEGRLTGVTDAAPQPFRPHGFKPAAGGTAHYQYDHNGNLTSDAHKGIQFSYNHLNLPLSISTPQGTLHFLYDATGRKWAKSGPEGIRFYAGNIEYLDGKVQHIAFADGRLVAEYNENGIFQNEYRAEYFRTDHLGNTRLTFSDFNHDGVISPRISSGTPTAYETEITSENHYYPFGLGHTGPWYASVAPENNYRYNGKEWNEDWGLNMYDYGARWYMPDLGRWGGVDALAEKFLAWSQFNYVLGNPISTIDLDGLDTFRIDARQNLSVIKGGENVVFISASTGKKLYSLEDLSGLSEGNYTIGPGLAIHKDIQVDYHGFLDYLGTVASESSPNMEEARGIGNVIFNRIENTNILSAIKLSPADLSISIMQKMHAIGPMYGRNEDAFNDISTGNVPITRLFKDGSAFNSRVKGAVKAIQDRYEGNDTSGGAYFWEGASPYNNRNNYFNKKVRDGTFYMVKTIGQTHFFSYQPLSSKGVRRFFQRWP